jgi:hypothetical protein
MRLKWMGAIAPVVVLLGLPGVARADDPNDPAMRSAAARARDHERIRQLNLAQLAMVQKRDAGYAEGWAAVRAARERGDVDDGASRSAYSADRNSYEQALADHARDRARYEQDMADWRRAVAACRGGDWSACER